MPIPPHRGKPGHHRRQGRLLRGDRRKDRPLAPTGGLIPRPALLLRQGLESRMEGRRTGT